MMKRTVVGVLVFMLVGAGTAQADTPAPITLVPEQVQKICEQRVPRLLDRIDGLTDRINGGPEVIGSVKWLEARAAAAAGDQAVRLRERASRRSGHLEKLGKAGERLAAFKKEHC